MGKVNKMNKEEVIIVKNDEQELNDIKTVSGKIRYLNGKGKTRSEISKILNIRYQHVRNVLVTPLKKV